MITVRRNRGERYPIEFHFWKKVEPIPFHSCWEWVGSKTRLGYGQMSGGGAGRKMSAHRASWHIHFGEIPAGASVCHRCDNRGCVNPGHLFLGSHADNMHDMKNKKRLPNARKTHCVRGHAFDEANTLVSKKGRECRACRRLYQSNNHGQRMASQRRRRSAGSAL